MKRLTRFAALVALLSIPTAWAAPVFVTFESAGANVAAITPMRDDFRAAIGGGAVAECQRLFWRTSP